MSEIDKTHSAIKRFVLVAEKNLSINDYYGISNVVGPDGLHKIYSILDGLVYEGRRFRVLLKTFIEGDYHTGAQIHYIVTDRKTKTEYEVIHYCPNRDFDNTFGWHIKEKEDKKK